jgi:hypothetical protein
MKRRPRESFRPCCEQLEDRGLLSVLTPAQMRHAYGTDIGRSEATTNTSDISGPFVLTPSDRALAPTARVSTRPVTVSASRPFVLDLHLVDLAIAEMGKLRLLS